MPAETKIENEFRDLIKSYLAETGEELDASADELAVYAASRAAHLATIAGEPGFEVAVRAERDSIALKAGIAVTLNAAAADQRLIGIIQGSLQVAARALAGAL